MGLLLVGDYRRMVFVLGWFDRREQVFDWESTGLCFRLRPAGWCMEFLEGVGSQAVALSKD